MRAPEWNVRRVETIDDALIEGLTDVLIDCVEGDASVSFMRPVTRERGRTLLVLDTASEEAKRLYERLGWIRVGVIPDYALLPRGGYCDTTVYYRKLD